MAKKQSEHSGFLASLDQLQGALEAAGANSPYRTVTLSKIHRDPNQPRTEFGDEEDAALAASIGEHGIVQPIVVQPHPDLPGEFLIVAGERRWRAAQEAGLDEVPILLRDELGPADALVMQLIENDQRKPLGLLDTARSLARLIELTGWTQAEAARHLGRTPSWVNRHLALLEQGDHTTRALENGALQSLETARMYAQLPQEDQERLLQKAAADDSPIPRGEVERSLRLVQPPSRSSKPGRPDAPQEPRRGPGRPKKTPAATVPPDPHGLFPVSLAWPEILTLFSRLDAPTPTPETWAAQLKSILKKT